MGGAALKKKPTSEKPGEEDAALWKKVAKTVKPYHGKMTAGKAAPAAKSGKNPAAKPSAKPPEKNPAAPPAAAPRQKAPPGKVPLGTQGFDKSTAAKLKKGKMPIEGRLDLHGMTQAQAQGALRRFVADAAGNGKRTVLVITGKGRLSEQGGVLRRMLPLWLEDPALAKHVVALTPAAQKDGGAGAFYLRLRKRRKD
ncbi:MAG: DNA mismatch repair protein MutS [Alphaproteobacteria bacterium]|nr:DNA mismatch repair protein MutS [Alphaproteobacteria bacterium]